MNAFTRQDYFVCSKIPPGFATYQKAPNIIKASNKSVDLGYLDCMLLLWPGTQKADENDPINIENRHGCWSALEEAVEAGSIMGAGVSNFQVRHLEKLMEYSKMKPIMNQIEVHPLYFDEDTIKFCQENDIVVEAYAPFAQGNEKLLTNVTLNEIARRNEIDVHQLILLWCLQRGFVILPRSSNEERQTRNICLEGLELSEDDMKEINELKTKKKD